MQIRQRVNRLEREAEVRLRPPPATSADALAWTDRFRAADPANESLWNTIRGWGRQHNVEYIGPWRGEDIHAGECLKALYFLVTPPVCQADAHLGESFPPAPALLRGLATAIVGYQDRSRDLYPIDEFPMRLLRGPDRAGMLRVLLEQCDVADRCVLDPTHPDVLAYRQMWDGVVRAA